MNDARHPNRCTFDGLKEGTPVDRGKGTRHG